MSQKIIKTLEVLLTLSYLGSIAALLYAIFTIDNPMEPTAAKDQEVLAISLLCFIIFLVFNFKKFKK